ncbi:MAG: trigger factor [Coprobacillus sp.]|nr:trigger factor [Coprobacillus sp.]
MEKKITKLEHCRIQIDVDVDPKTWQDAQQKAFDKLAANVKVDGFRPGKAPKNLVKDKVDPQRVTNDAINDVANSIHRQLLEEENIRPIAQTELDVPKVSDTELSLSFIFTTEPEAEIKSYKGFEIGKPTVEVTDEEINHELEHIQEDNATLTPVDREAKEGDTVVIDFVGEVDGKEFEGGSATNHELELGSHSFIPGFEDQLVGAKSEEKRDVNVTFPEEYQEESLAGKPALFHVTVHEVKEKALPPLDDELAKTLQIPNVTTIDGLRNELRAEILQDKTQHARDDYFNKLLEEIAKDAKVDIPEQAITSQMEYLQNRDEQQLAQSGLDLQTYLSMIGQTKEEYDAMQRENSIKAITNQVIIDAIGEKEEVSITDSDLEFEYAKIAEQYHTSIEEVKKAYEPQKARFKDSVRFNRILDILYRDNN